MTALGRFSMGIGDRFGHQGRAQLRAIAGAAEAGMQVTPVWNKSFREHSLIGTRPEDVRAEADAAARAERWSAPCFVDADHISLKTVDTFLNACDFYTLDVADVIGRPAPREAIEAFVRRRRAHTGALRVPGIETPLQVSEADIRRAAEKFLGAVQEAGLIYRHIAAARGAGTFITEVSMDETDQPQSPAELLFILAALADEKIPAQTIAPRFTGRFNKGVDYEGDVARFAREFEQDLHVIAFAIREFGLPSNLKLSLHSGSDKFAIYEPIRAALARTGAGLHVKTAGTTWLEELTGLAEAGGSGLAVAQELYRTAYGRIEELCKPYASVIAVDRARLPSPNDVAGWDSRRFAETLRHDTTCPAYNPHFRQFMHVSFRVAAEMGPRFQEALDRHADIIARNVTANLERHLRRVFPTPRQG